LSPFFRPYVSVVAVFPAALLAHEVRCVVDAARAHVARAFRIGADGPGALDHAVVHARGDDLLRRHAVLDPSLECGERVPGVRAAGRAAAAVTDVREQEEPCEVLALGLLLTLG